MVWLVAAQILGAWIQYLQHDYCSCQSFIFHMRQTAIHRTAPHSAPSVRSLFRTTLLAPAQFQGAAGFLENLRAPANTTITLYSKLQYPVPIKSCPYAYPTRYEVVGKRWKRTSTYLNQRNDQRHVWTIFIFLLSSCLSERKNGTQQGNKSGTCTEMDSAGVIKSVKQCNSSALMECDIVQPSR